MKDDSSNRFVCPSCGTTVVIEESEIDYKKYKLQCKEREQEREDEKDRRIVKGGLIIYGLVMLVCILIGVLASYFKL
jgi:hypothetical protein